MPDGRDSSGPHRRQIVFPAAAPRALGEGPQTAHAALQQAPAVGGGRRGKELFALGLSLMYAEVFGEGPKSVNVSANRTIPWTDTARARAPFLEVLLQSSRSPRGRRTEFFALCYPVQREGELFCFVLAVYVVVGDVGQILGGRGSTGIAAARAAVDDDAAVAADASGDDVSLVAASGDDVSPVAAAAAIDAIQQLFGPRRQGGRLVVASAAPKGGVPRFGNRDGGFPRPEPEAIQRWRRGYFPPAPHRVVAVYFGEWRERGTELGQGLAAGDTPGRGRHGGWMRSKIVPAAFFLYPLQV